MNTITCSKCGNSIEINQALEAEVRHSIELRVKAEQKVEIERLKKEAEEQAIKRMTEHFELERKRGMVEVEENRQQNKKLQEQLLELMGKLEKEKLRAENTELEMRKKLLETQDKLFTDAKNKASEEYKLTIAELSKQISDFKKANEDLNRKLEQRSQQLQGEVQELDLELTLHQAFVFDTVEPVGKGVRGADVRQIVKTQMGNVCGVILWESKQTKAWSQEWISKLKNDLRAEKANIPIIVSTQLPDEAKSGFGMKDGVCLVSPTLILPVAEIMRSKLIELAREKYIAQNKGEKADDLFSYVISHEFRQQLEALAEVYQEMQGQISRERIVFEKIWKAREAQTSKVFTSTSRIVGSMSGIIGQSFPQMKGFELTADSVQTEVKLIDRT